MSDEVVPMPPATFEFLVFSLRTQAEMSMGLYLGEDGEPEEPDFALAKHSIDLLAVLHEKTRGNLNPEEQQLLDQSLAEMQFHFVQAMEELPQPQEPSRIIIP